MSVLRLSHHRLALAAFWVLGTPLRGRSWPGALPAPEVWAAEGPASASRSEDEWPLRVHPPVSSLNSEVPPPSHQHPTEGAGNKQPFYLGRGNQRLHWIDRSLACVGASRLCPHSHPGGWVPLRPLRQKHRLVQDTIWRGRSQGVNPGLSASTTLTPSAAPQLPLFAPQNGNLANITVDGPCAQVVDTPGHCLSHTELAMATQPPLHDSMRQQNKTVFITSQSVQLALSASLLRLWAPAALDTGKGGHKLQVTAVCSTDGALTLSTCSWRDTSVMSKGNASEFGGQL